MTFDHRKLLCFLLAIVLACRFASPGAAVGGGEGTKYNKEETLMHIVRAVVSDDNKYTQQQITNKLMAENNPLLSGLPGLSKLELDALVVLMAKSLLNGNTVSTLPKRKPPIRSYSSPDPQ